MSEIEDLIGIYGFIDQAVVEDPSLVEVVAPFFGPYQHGAAGWFDEFTAWAAALLDREASELFPPLETALGNLSDIPMHGRMAARRLLLVAVAARVLDHSGTDTEVVDSDLVGALALEEIDDDGRSSLLALLRDPATFGSLSDWAALLNRASEEGLIPHSLAIQAAAPPCAGTVVLVDVAGDLDPVAVLETSFCTTELTLERAKRFLEPVNWPGCSSFWCEMTPTAPSAAGNPTYHEVVSVNCANKTTVWTAEACLEFRMAPLPDDGALVTYNLCEGHPQTGALILVDSGTLTVQQIGPEVCVHTTKRILFDHPFSGPSLAMLTCALGYAAIAEDLVFSCALADEQAGDGGTEFPGSELPIDPGAGGGPGRPHDPHTDLKDVVDEAVHAAKQCIEDCAVACQASFDKVMAGDGYKADDLVKDMSQMWTRLLRDGAMALDLGIQAARVVATRPGPPPDPAPTDDG